ncbi:MAG: sigma-70 family RNA polymerase sigma factor, partial [Flavobacteriales bacterium]|nr:sigma-70 family RNA polymerase sigma factor [Flavobacteriales bacterium]
SKATGWILVEDASVEELADDVETDEDDMEMSFTVQDVLRAMERLTPVYRAVFNLYVFENMRHQEIADQLGITVGTSKSNLAKARRNLRKVLLETGVFKS